MKRKLVLLVLLILTIYSGIASAELAPDDYQYMLKNLSDKFCKNKDYLECLSLTERKCIKSIEVALQTCPTKATGSSETQMIDGVCISMTFYKATEVPENKINTCEKKHLNQDNQYEPKK